ncbi:MAG: hypothetical protein JNN07_21760 [Verrucomicrobiales bacterium]|nr:hypothetical protein [Verrucomicrobiales bacterium]
MKGWPVYVWGVLFSLVLTLIPSALLADSGSFCAICGERSFGDMYFMKDKVRSSKVVVCERCAKLPQRCSSCGLPVFVGGKVLSDNRSLCAVDMPLAVLDQDVAVAIYEDVKRDLFSLMNGLGVLPDRNITVRLVDQRQLARVFAGIPTAHPDASLQGVTRTRRFSKEGLEHEIFLCLGLPRNRLAAVAAHEYAHAWVHENVPVERVLDRDTVEAFCELAAFEVMRQRGDQVEMGMIRENTYTRGKIDVLLKASADYQFHRVAQWMKAGTDETLERERMHRVTSLKPSDAPSFGYLAVVQARVPEILVLKGLSGTPPKQFALINDATLRVGEEARVRVAQTNVLVRCVEIREQSVTVRINGASEVTELRLRDRD